jgi:hypothetical protein
MQPGCIGSHIIEPKEDQIKTNHALTESKIPAKTILLLNEAFAAKPDSSWFSLLIFQQQSEEKDPNLGPP